LIATLATAVIHIMDNFFLNILLLLHAVVCFFVLFGMHTERNKKRVRKELYIVATVILIATTVGMIASFAVLPLGAMKIKFLYSTYRLVIYENRFTGVFINPNLLGFYSVLAIVMAHILSKDELYSNIGKSVRFPLWFLVATSVINLIGLFMSDSNGAILLLTGYIVGISIYKFLGGMPSINIPALMLRGVAIILVAVISLGLLLGVRTVVNKSASYLMNHNHQIVEQKPNKPAVKNNNKNIVTFAHENENLDSGRLALLEKAVKIFYNYPILGVGKENIVLFGQRILDKGLKYTDLHNGYLTILVSNGLVGFVLFIGFAVSMCRQTIKSLFLEKRNLKNSPYVCLFAFVFAYCIYAVIEKTMLWEHTFMVATFWYMLGYLIYYVKKYDHNDDSFDFKALLPNKKQGTSQEIDIIDIPTDE
jgi:O-antigen ligase